jgi:chromate transport protein
MGYGAGMSVLGSAIATFALVLPTFILMILITKMFMRYMKTTAVQSVFEGLRPAVVGLLAAATLMLMNSENFGSFGASRWQFCISIALFIATFVGTKVIKINPIHMILYAAFAGIMLL